MNMDKSPQATADSFCVVSSYGFHFFFLFGGEKATCIHSFVHSFWFFKIEVQLTHISFSCTTW